MKAFRGTLVALVVLLVVVGAWFALRPQQLTPKERKELAKKQEGVPLFVFEKTDLVKVEVQRPDDRIVLAEKEDGWRIEGSDLRASRNMVNKVKHQLHDLVARASVVEDADEPALYGLGPSAIHVTLTFRDGRTACFDAGDPNPSGVSFYLRRCDDEIVYTVKKSAVDYYALSLTDFRERRFASFDSKDVDVLDATLPDGSRLAFQRTGEHAWDMTAPRPMAAADDEVRALLGRVSAMKAVDFVSDDPLDASRYGLDHPRLVIALRFSGRDPLTLLVGADTGRKDGEYPLAWVKLAEEPSIYTARAGLLDDYLQDPGTFRLKRFARMDPNTLVSVVATYAPAAGADADLAGTVTVKQAADRWQWDDGVLVPGSTPRRLATRAADLTADEFVADASDDVRYGFDHPLVRVEMRDDAGQVRTVLLGAPAPAAPPGPEGQPRPRWYARTVEFPEVYIVDPLLLEVVKDLMREHGRHARGEAEQAERQERIEADRKKEAAP